jgi:hypothetical protein
MSEHDAVEEIEEVEIFDCHDEILELLRDAWPTMKGSDILWFQNDLFHKLRRLETKIEGVGIARGFLPASFELIGSEPQGWKVSDHYEEVWNSLINSDRGEADVTALDSLEDDIIGWVEDMIPSDYNFFIAALDIGTLNAEWLNRAQLFLEKAAADKALAASEASAEPITESSNPVRIKVIEKRISSPNTRRRLIGLPLTPSRVRRKIRHTRRNHHKD